jgi:peroxisomal enoyl-CoA hydratase 2
MARSKAENLKEFQARIASPMKPGDKLITRMWRMALSEGLREVRFETQIEGGKICSSNGCAIIKEE